MGTNTTGTSLDEDHRRPRTLRLHGGWVKIGADPRVKVVLFCGGLGMRMREGATAAPKPMAMIGDRPLLWHVMRYYAHFGHTDFVLCLGYGAAEVKEYFLRYDETLSNDFILRGGGECELLCTDITDWNITFIDTGLAATIGERLMAGARPPRRARSCSWPTTPTPSPTPAADDVARFRRSDAAVSLVAVPPASSHHVVESATTVGSSPVRAIRDLRQWENGGYFVMRPEVFDALRPRARTSCPTR